jgi:hypothetical protein
MQFRTKININRDNDIGFYNAVVKLLANCLRETIRVWEVQDKKRENEYMERVEAEIDRLFKTNVFNTALRI